MVLRIRVIIPPWYQNVWGWLVYNLVQMGDKSRQIEPIMYMLFGGMVFFTGMLLFVEKYFNNDGQIFQVVAGLLAGFSGSFFTRLNPKQTTSTDLPPNTAQVQTTTTITPPPTTPAP